MKKTTKIYLTILGSLLLFGSLIVGIMIYSDNHPEFKSMESALLILIVFVQLILTRFLLNRFLKGKHKNEN